MRPVPDFLVIGARKSGTTTVDAILRMNPGLHLPPSTKEVYFFDRYSGRGLPWYRAQFGAFGADQLVGEVTPSYLSYADAAHVHAVNATCRFVVVLRDPVERAWSDFRHYARKGDLPSGATFRDAAAAIPGIVEEGRYFAALERWFEHFPRERFHFVATQDLRIRPEVAFSGIFGHLGAPSLLIEGPPVELNADQPLRSLVVSRWVHRTSRALHRRGLHGPVALAKRSAVIRMLTVRRLAEQRLDARAAFRKEDRAWLRELYGPDCRDLVAAGVGFAAAWLPLGSSTDDD